MTQKILRLFMEKGFLLDKEMLDFFSRLEDEGVANEILKKVQIISGEKLITKTLINNNLEKIQPVFSELDKDKKKLVERFFVNVSVSVEVKKETSIEEGGVQKGAQKSSDSSLKIISSPVILNQKLEVKDFVKHFRNRYNFFKGLLQEDRRLDNLTSIDKISVGNGGRTFSIIGIVTSKALTKNKNFILEVEDLTGRTKVLINNNKEEIFNKGKEIVLDDVVGFKCSGSRDFLFVNDLFYPDCFLEEKKKLDEEVYALFISDMHLGSKNFLKDNFERFVEWLGGKGCDRKQKRVLKKIKYLFVTGDSVDGVGAYPGQEKDLEIKDVKKQYEKLTEFYKKIPKHISIIQCAGQHDAVRVAIPQPPIGEDFAEPLLEIENLYLVSNPSLIEIEGSEKKQGFKILMYHGAGIIPHIIHEIEELRLSKNNSKTLQKIRKKELFIYFYLYPIYEGHPLLIKLRETMRLARTLDSKIMFYITPINITAALRNVGQEFGHYFSENLKTVKDVFSKEKGRILTDEDIKSYAPLNESSVCLDYSQVLESDCFFHTESIDDHLNQKGRGFISRGAGTVALKLLEKDKSIGTRN